MLRQDRLIEKKLKRRINVLLTILLFLSYWTFLLKDESSYYQTENNILNYEIMDAEFEISKLKHKISELQSKVPAKENKPKIINTKKTEIKKDSVEIKVVTEQPLNPIVDTLN